MTASHFTPRLALPYPDESDPADVPVDLVNLANKLDGGVTAYGQGTASQRPVAGVQGRLWYSTDTGVVSWDTGAAWVTIGPYTPPSGKRFWFAVGNNAGDYITASASFVMLPTPTVTLTLAVVTTLRVEADFTVANGPAGASGYVQLYAGAAAIAGSYTLHQSATDSQRIPMSIRGVATYNPGTYTFQIGRMLSGGANTTIFNSNFLNPSISVEEMPTPS